MAPKRKATSSPPRSGRLPASPTYSATASALLPHDSVKEPITPTTDSERKIAATPKLYNHRPLRKGNIRILYLRPGAQDDALRGSLNSAFLEERPKYRAISYAWGEPLFTKTLHLSGAIHRITPSLAAALRRFRDGQKTVALWADQICINQEDLEERKQQVAHMGRIFSIAEEVLVWLGESTGIDIQNFWLLYNIGRENQQDRSLQWYPRVRRHLDRVQQECEGCAIPQCPCCLKICQQKTEYFEYAVKMLESLWSRSWFQRLWVVEEFHLAKTTTLYCGSHFISGNTLVEAVENLYPLDMRSADLEDTAVMLSDVSGSAFDPSTSAIRRLIMVILETTKLSCSEKRDKVYAVATLCGTTLSQHDRSFFESIEPDYTRPVDRLWFDVSKSFLESPYWGPSTSDNIHPSLLLALPATQSQVVGQPTLWSWVPDLSILDREAHKKYYNYIHEGSGFSTGGPMLSRFPSVTNDYGLLRFNGKIISAIKSISSGSQWPVYPKDIFSSFLPFIENHLIPWCVRCCEFMQSLREIWGATAKREIIHRGRKSWEAELPFVEFQKAYSKIQPQHQGEALQTYVVLGRLLDNEYSRIDWNDSQQLLAFTTDGRFAWVPGCTQVSDLVVALETCPFPFVLRPTGDGQYRIIGDSAYTEGIMLGEAWPDDPAELEDIVIV